MFFNYKKVSIGGYTNDGIAFYFLSFFGGDCRMVIENNGEKQKNKRKTKEKQKKG